MASLTTGTCCRVRSWFRHYAWIGATVTSCAARYNACVVHCRTSKAGGALMAGITLHTGWYVSRRFTFCTCIIMTSRTTSHNASVVHAGRYPRSGTVTGVA